jgi:hypothetical protein
MLWGKLKGKVYRNTARTADDLQNEIRNVVASISADELQHVSQGFVRRCEECFRAAGNHFGHFLYYMVNFFFVLPFSYLRYLNRGFQATEFGRVFQ